MCALAGSCPIAKNIRSMLRRPFPSLQIDALEGRFAQVVGYRGATPKELMQQLSAQLSEIEAGLAPSAANGGGLQGKIKALAAAARMRAGAPSGGRVAELEGQVEPAQLEQLFGILSQ